jgi:hypothetical protein
MYLLPADVETVIQELRRRVGIKIIRPSSPTLNPVEVHMPFENQASTGREGERFRINCFLVPVQRAEIKMRYLQAPSYWSVGVESEAIEFSGGDFDGKVLVRGRFYFQNDILIGDSIVPKRQEFLEWADKVFRSTKKQLHRSKELNAYVGPEAEAWRQKNGKFASLLIPGREPIYD